MTRNQVDVAVAWWGSQLVGVSEDDAAIFMLALEDTIYQLQPEMLTTSDGQYSRELLESLEDAGLTKGNIAPSRSMDLSIDNMVIVRVGVEDAAKIYPV